MLETVLTAIAGRWLTKASMQDSDIQDVATTDKNGKRTGKVANHKRPLPPGLTKQEQNALKKTMRRAHRLDEAFSICGIRIGWSVVIGIVPL